MRNWTARAATVAALTTGAALAMSGPATADNINDTIEGDGVSLTLTAGSATGATGRIKLVSTNGDGDQQCNIDAGEQPLKLDLVTPAGVTADVDPLVITQCDTFYTVTFTAAADAVGGTVTATILSGPAGGGDYNNNVRIPITITQPQVDPEEPADEDPPADTTAPDISYTLSPATPDGSNGWWTSNVSVDWTVTDAESAISSSTGCDDVTISADQAAQTYTCSATSAGGTSSVTTESIQRDATAPSNISFGGVPTSVYFGDAIGPFTCTADDATSGLAGCTTSGGGTSVGTHTVTGTATDNAGNQGSTTTSYDVLAWTLKGFYAPVDMGGTLNTVKGGSTVPLKFELFAGSRELTDTSSVKSFVATKITCNASADLDAVEFVTTGATSLRYDATAGQFVQNWKVPTGAGTCYRVTMTSQDDSRISALFKVK